ncbi:glycosyltransferase [Paraconexibacter antarcticus]|uniref:Glycosyltransferase n=1 Tax=Paraconexibacter antarcticus TaxID=2949664 RepID=A0ABY5DNQ4_9ACTN|nr:glycosyltransferase [Paraconexibacter antarcticus]UTI62491.1 glycosyltransferase [Paraconexibacter antarcticus]
MTSGQAPSAPRHVLLLTDRDWTHPQGGGTGTNLFGQVSRWLAWGHTVTVIAGAYDGCEAVSRPHERLTIHRMGTRLTVFPRAARATRRGVAADADVVLEVVNGIAFFTPLWWWLKRPVVALVHHVHQDHYEAELGLRGRVAAQVLERLPLTVLYRGRPVLTISDAARDELVELGVPGEDITVTYMGVDPSGVPAVPRSPTPRLLYLGRLKAYKRIEHVLDVLEHVPDAHLDIAGDGDHRAALEAEIAERGLGPRVTLHGHVSEERKQQLYDEAWVSLTASSAEGWCLTVMEAALRGTPSAALRVGGLPESIADGRTGVLADTPDELAAEVAALCADDERRERLGTAARERAEGFSWDVTATANLAVLGAAADAPRPALRARLRASDTGKAGALAGASLANNAIQLIFTIAVTRLLGRDGYGALAALISAFLILLVGGQSLQAAAAREVALGRLGGPEVLAATVRDWTRTLARAFVVLAAVGLLVRVPLASLTGTPEHPWAAAALPVTGVMWLLVSLQRGVLQGLHAFRPVGLSIVGEAAARLVLGLVLAATAGVTGAFLATVLTFAVVAAWLDRSIGERMLAHRGSGAAVSAGNGPARRGLRGLVGGGWVPIGALLLLAVLQNVDVIIARHQLGHDRAGSYAVAAVAAKAVVWVAIGVGLQLLPQATARAAAGLDPRPVLYRALGILAVVATPALLIFALVPRLLLRVTFGPDTVDAAPALLVLGLAMTLLAVAYLTVQFMIALGEVRFLWVLAAVAAGEMVLLFAGRFSITGFAAVVAVMQLLAAGAVLVLAARAWPARHATAPPPATA